jgi:hypothetical protein
MSRGVIYFVPGYAGQYINACLSLQFLTASWVCDIKMIILVFVFIVALVLVYMIH